MAVEARRRPYWIRRHVLFLVALDATAAVAATAIARYVRFGVEDAELLVRTWSIPYSLLGVVLVPTWLVVLAVGRCYDVGPFGTGVRLRRVIRAGANFMALVAVVYFVLQVENLRRGFLAVAVTLAVGFSLALRALARRYLRSVRREGHAVRRALVVGSRPTVAAVIRRLGRRRGTELRPVGACVPDPDRPLLVNERDVPVHGGLDDVLPAITASGADALVLTGSVAQGRVQRLAWALEGTGIDVFVVPALAQQPVDLDVRPVAGLPLVYVNQGRAPAPLPPPVAVATAAVSAAATAEPEAPAAGAGIGTNGVAAAPAAHANRPGTNGSGVRGNGTHADGAGANGVTTNGAGANGAPTNGVTASGAPTNGVTASGAPTNGGAHEIGTQVNGAAARGNGTTTGTGPNGAARAVPANGAPNGSSARGNGTATNGAVPTGAAAHGATANGNGDGSGRRGAEPSDPERGDGRGPWPAAQVARRPPAKAPARR